METRKMKSSFWMVVAMGAFSNVANAQSSVTLDGVIDEGFEKISNVKTGPGGGKTLYQLDSTSGALGSRWGMRGSEDLGSGLKAIFLLENGFEINTGKLNQGGDEWGRQTYVGLSSTTYGSVTLGRQYDSVVDF